MEVRIDQFKPRQREIILDVVTLLGNRRPPSITTKAIASRRNITEASLYRHYPSKNAILAAVVGVLQESLKELWQMVPKNSDDPIAACHELLDSTVLFLQAYPGFCRIITREALHPNFKLEEQAGVILDILRIELRSRLITLPDPLRTIGDQPALVSEATAYAFAGAISKWVAAGFQPNLNDIWQNIAKVLLRDRSKD